MFTNIDLDHFTAHENGHICIAVGDFKKYNHKFYSFIITISTQSSGYKILIYSLFKGYKENKKEARLYIQWEKNFENL